MEAVAQALDLQAVLVQADLAAAVTAEVTAEALADLVVLAAAEAVDPIWGTQADLVVVV